MLASILHYNFTQEGNLLTGPSARHMIGAPGIGIPKPGPDFPYKVFIQNQSRGSRCLIKGSVLYYYKKGTPSIGFDQLCWHNFRIIGTDFSGISTEHNSERSEVYTDPASIEFGMASLRASKTSFSLATLRVEFHRRLQGCRTKWATFTKRGGSYPKSTLVLDSMTHQVKPCVTVDLKLSPFLANLDVGFFSVATDVKHRFLSFGIIHGGHIATESLNSLRPLNSFWRRLKSSPVLGLSLPGPLLSPCSGNKHLLYYLR